METNEVFRGRLIDHIQLVVNDLSASMRFYRAVFEALKIPIGGEGDGFFWADEVFVSAKGSVVSGDVKLGATHLAFQAKDKAMVERFYEAGLKAGGKTNGTPGERAHYHPGYYAAFLFDPDGNNIEAVYHGPAKFSAESIRITF
jgi:catechol 2,3-dioxygenase-like lactoylglutathione lyase family enzyme